MVAGTNQVERGSKKSDEDTELSHPRADYFKVRKAKASFRGAFSIDPIDSNQLNEMSAVIIKMIHTTVENGFPESKLSELQDIIAIHAIIFRVLFSLSPPRGSTSIMNRPYPGHSFSLCSTTKHFSRGALMHVGNGLRSYQIWDGISYSSVLLGIGSSFGSKIRTCKAPIHYKSTPSQSIYYQPSISYANN